MNYYVENMFWKKDKLIFSAWKKFQIVIRWVISLLLWLNKLYCETVATLSCKSLWFKLKLAYCYPTGKWGSKLTHFVCKGILSGVFQMIKVKKKNICIGINWPCKMIWCHVVFMDDSRNHRVCGHSVMAILKYAYLSCFVTSCKSIFFSNVKNNLNMVFACMKAMNSLGHGGNWIWESNGTAVDDRFRSQSIW